MKHLTKLQINAMTGRLMSILQPLKISQRNKWIKDHLQNGGTKEEDALIRRRFNSIANHDIYRACLLLVWNHYKNDKLIIDAYPTKTLMPIEWEEFYQLVKF